MASGNIEIALKFLTIDNIFSVIYDQNLHREEARPYMPYGKSSPKSRNQWRSEKPNAAEWYK
jgi:hypothetical protein